MGTKLIIKGADFSSCAIPTDSDNLFSEISDAFLVNTAVQLSDGSGGAKTITVVNGSNPARCCIYDVDLSKYYDKGYVKATISFKTGKSYVYGVGTSNTNVTTFVWSWANGPTSLEITLNSTNKCLFFNLKNTDGSDISSSTTASDFISKVSLE